MIGTLLKKHRRTLGLQQQWVAEQAGVTPMTLSRLERGITRGWNEKPLNPYWDTVGRIAAVLNISLDALWQEEQRLVHAEQDVVPPEALP